MANDILNFHCPACGIFLTVPASLAGVVGPCPSCRHEIQAPISSEATADPAPLLVPNHPPLAAIEEPPIPIAVMPDPPPVSQSLLPDATDFPSHPTASSSDTETAKPISSIPSSVRSKPIDPPILRIELTPRETFAATPPPIVKSFSEPHAESTAEPPPLQRAQQPSRATWSARLIRILLPLLFFLLMAAAVFGILTFVSNRTQDEPAPEPVTLPAPLPDPPAQATPPTSKNSAVPELKSASDSEAVKSANTVYEVLEKFLSAQSLAERLPLLETKTTEIEMAKSCLAQPFPKAHNIAQDSKESHPNSQFTDYFYRVDFDSTDQHLNAQTLLVRKRGDDSPKIVVDPFLDSFDGRLATFAATPNNETELFQVIVDPLASCNDETVPHREKKFTLKLLPRENEREIALAYCGRQSRIGLMLENGAYDLNFGKAKACTVMLRWNSEERPESPYLEALEIKSLDWNP